MWDFMHWRSMLTILVGSRARRSAVACSSALVIEMYGFVKGRGIVKSDDEEARGRGGS